jgi:hypothetical protein
MFRRTFFKTFAGVTFAFMLFVPTPRFFALTDYLMLLIHNSLYDRPAMPERKTIMEKKNTNFRSFIIGQFVTNNVEYQVR